jgi:hypothetical protein
MVTLLQQTAFMCSVCVCMCQLNGFMAEMECVYCAVRTEVLYISLILVCKRKKRGLLHSIADSSRPLNNSNTTVSFVWLRVVADVLRLGAASNAAQRSATSAKAYCCTVLRHRDKVQHDGQIFGSKDYINPQSYTTGSNANRVPPNASLPPSSYTELFVQ